MTQVKSMLLLAALSVAAFGCNQQPAAERAVSAAGQGAFAPITGTPQQQVRLTVERYNALLAQGYRNLNMTGLQEVASKDEAEKAYVHMAALSEGKSRLISQLNKISYLSLEFPTPDSCRLATDERWDFAQEDLASGARSEEQKNFLYHVHYDLERQGGHWLVTRVVANSDEPDKPGRARSAAAMLPPGHGR
jgi:hypothetical protein